MNSLSRQLVVPVVFLLAMGAAIPRAAHASTPPSPPTQLVGSLAATDAFRPAASLSWSPSTDADGTVAGYAVEVATGDGAFGVATTSSSTTAFVEGLSRGVTYRLRVVAVDDAGDRSAPSEAVSLLADALTTTVSLRQDGRPCLRSCTYTSLDLVQLQLVTHAAHAGRAASVLLTHRPPGERFRPAGALELAIDAAGAARLALARTPMAQRSGTWCMRATLAATSELAAASSPATCLRYRPRVTIGWAGDITLGSSYGHPPADGSRIFSRVRSLLQAPDLMIGNYEGVLASRPGSSRCSGGALCYIFVAPPRRAFALARAGFNVMNLANNHALDAGQTGRRQTAMALREAGLGVAGLPGTVLVRQVQDTRVAMVGISQYPGTTSTRDFAAIRSLVRRADRSADVVVLLMHGGLEGAAGAHVPRGSDYNSPTYGALHVAVDAGADVVYGSGPHVVRGVERYRGKFIVYSSGNFAGWRNFGLGGLTSQSGVVSVAFDHLGRSSSGRWDPVRLVGPGIPMRDHSGAVVRRVRSLSRADFGRRAARFSPGGAFR